MTRITSNKEKSILQQLAVVVSSRLSLQSTLPSHVLLWWTQSTAHRKNKPALQESKIARKYFFKNTLSKLR